MSNYVDTKRKIIDTLMGRAPLSEVQPDKHQDYALSLLEYIRQIELIPCSGLQGVAEAETVPVQPDNARVFYITGVGKDSLVIYSSFRGQNGNPIAIATSPTESVFGVLIWNMQYWSVKTFPTSVIANINNIISNYSTQIKKVYGSIEEMNADAVNPIGSDGLPILIGQVISIGGSGADAGSMYVYNGSSFTYVGQTGVSGREIELKNDIEYIWWRYTDQETWTQLISLAELRGEDGSDGTSDYPTEVLNGFTRTELVSGAILWKEGLTYNSLNISYKILGVNYTALDKEYTLDPASQTLSRIDLFYADIFGNVCVMKGTPAVNPTTPILNSTQLFIMQVLIAPGATTPAGLDVTVVYDENIEWAATKTQDAFVTIDLDSTLEPKRGIKRIQFDIVVPVNEIVAPLHYIGEKYQGGIIFWLAPDGKSGLICSLSDAANGVFYASLDGGGQSTGANGTIIGTGQSNTAKMLIQPKTLGHAVKYCDELIIDGYSDWFMPSKDELSAMYFRRFLIGGFANKMYWSSTEYNYKRAYSVSFANGVADYWDKNRAFSVRAIRAFDDTTIVTTISESFFTPSATKVEFVSPSAVSSKDGVLSMYLKSSIPWRFNSILIIESLLDGIVTGVTSLSPSTSTQGYNHNSNEWQLIALPMARFGAKSNLVDGFKISLAGSWPNNIDFGIDDIRFQHTVISTAGIAVTPGTYGSTKKSAVITINNQGAVTNIEEVEITPVNEVTIGAVNGVNRIFSTSVPYESGTVTIFINGLKERSFIEISDTQIELAEAPKNNGMVDLIEITYIKKQI